jgi:rod shape determining protein RodA
VVNGARAWIGIGDLGIQPSEFAKIAVILFLARYLDNSEHGSSIRRLAMSLLILAIPVGLILSQPDFGTALVFFPILLFMLIVAGIDKKYILFLLISVLLTLIFTILPFWEKYILVRPSRFLFIFYDQPVSYLMVAALILALALSYWGWSTYKKRYYYWISFATLALALSIVASMFAHLALREYQIMRLIVFMDPSVDPRGSGWNILQSITAIGSGGFAGKGFLLGPQSHNRYIPQQSTDFIFSIVAEEWGFLGAASVFALFYILLNRCALIIRTVRDRFAMYVSSGIMGMIFFHFMINAGMAMGIMPITGIPLFFLSYGGSSLLTVMSAVGILLGIATRRYRT